MWDHIHIITLSSGSILLNVDAVFKQCYWNWLHNIGQVKKKTFNLNPTVPLWRTINGQFRSVKLYNTEKEHGVSQSIEAEKSSKTWKEDTVDCTSFNCMCGRMLLCFTSIRSGLVLGAFVSCMFGALYMLSETFIPFVWFVWACENNAIQTWQHWKCGSLSTGTSATIQYVRPDNAIWPTDMKRKEKKKDECWPSQD